MSDLDLYSLWDQVMQKTKTKMPQQMWDSLVVNSLMPYSMTSTILTLFVMDPSKLKYIQTPLVHNQIVEAAKSLLPTLQKIEYLTDTSTVDASSIDSMENTSIDIPPIPSIDMPSIEDTTMESSPSPIIPPPWDAEEYNEVLPEGVSRPSYDSPVIIQRNTSPSQGIQRPVPADLFASKTTVPVPPVQRNMSSSSKSHLNRAFTFDNYIESNSNRMAFSAAKAVAENPGLRYNPLYIHGQSGLGKTHLMHAIGNEILALNPSAKIMSITSEDFMNSFIESLRTKTPDQFRRNFRDIDVLIIDDVQFLEEKNKKTTQEEFFNTFNHLLSHNKAVILSSDKPPKDYKEMEERLITRFNSGLTVEIEAPNPEMIEAIIHEEIDHRRSEYPTLYVPKEVIHLFAQYFNKRNIRELKGAFETLITQAAITNRLETIDVEFTNKAIKDFIIHTEKIVLSIKYIQEFIADYFKIKLEHLVSQKRNKQYAHPRQIAMYLARELINESYPQISFAFGKKDHTTALHAYEKISREIEKDQDLRHTIDRIRKELEEAK
ncbi:chromosomal replication initiator protein DnaA [Veillonella sp. 3913]|uniref:chromosomal replication initiator protein DnaA n=1 Tax=Veillonella sp. 3913 TaxID=2490952 RepID=UPI0013DF98C9|nr:chromosomal replication initiator protein DnaA [Veillonella sp. 3913]